MAKMTAKPVTAKVGAAKPRVTGKPVNANEQKRAMKSMKAVGNAAMEVGRNPYQKPKPMAKKK